MKKTFLLISALLLCFASSQAQLVYYEATNVAYSSVDENGIWSDWTEWVEDLSEFTFDIDNSSLYFYNYIEDMDYDFIIIDASEEQMDEDGDMVTEFQCMDEDFEEMAVKIVRRLSEDDERTEIYFTYDTESLAFIVVDGLD